MMDQTVRRRVVAKQEGGIDGHAQPEQRAGRWISSWAAGWADLAEPQARRQEAGRCGRAGGRSGGPSDGPVQNGQRGQRGRCAEQRRAGRRRRETRPRRHRLPPGAATGPAQGGGVMYSRAARARGRPTARQAASTASGLVAARAKRATESGRMGDFSRAAVRTSPPCRRGLRQIRGVWAEWMGGGAFQPGTEWLGGGESLGV